MSESTAWADLLPEELRSMNIERIKSLDAKFSTNFAFQIRDLVTSYSQGDNVAETILSKLNSSYGEFYTALREAIQDKHVRKVGLIYNLSSIESLIIAKICEADGKSPDAPLRDLVSINPEDVSVPKASRPRGTRSGGSKSAPSVPQVWDGDTVEQIGKSDNNPFGNYSWRLLFLKHPGFWIHEYVTRANVTDWVPVSEVKDRFKELLPEEVRSLIDHVEMPESLGSLGQEGCHYDVTVLAKKKSLVEISEDGTQARLKPVG